MIIPVYRAPGDLNAFPHRIIHRPVGNDDVSTFRKCGNDARDGRKGLRIYNGGGYTQMGGYVGFSLHVDILSPVEAGWAAWTDTIVSQDLNSLFFDGFVREKVVEVVGGEVCDDAAV